MMHWPRASILLAGLAATPAVAGCETSASASVDGKLFVASDAVAAASGARDK